MNCRKSDFSMSKGSACPGYCQEGEKMFGYIICNKSKLAHEEIERYQRIYCGLCKVLEKRFGQLERMSLNYEMTFLVLFLTSLYEPEEEKTEFRCIAHPMKKKTAIENKFTEYAADMTIVMAYYKCLDDWEDEHRSMSRKYGELLEKSYKEIEQRYPRQCRSVSEGIQELRNIEKSPESEADDAVNCSGRVLSEMFVYEEDFWSSSLRTFGYELGRFIYLMDAVMDYKKDLKTGNYNPLRKMNKKPEEMEEILMSAIGNAAQVFESLPIVQDVHLIRNILYGGVWQKYYAKVAGKEGLHG